MSSSFKKYYTPVVDLMYPRLSVTEKWNNVQRKFSICDATDRGAFWACSFVLSDAERAAMWEVGMAHYVDCMSREQLPPIEQGKTIFRSEAPHKDPEGNLVQGQWIYKATRNTKNAQGHPSKRPLVLNGMNDEITRVDFWSGSKGRLCISMKPTIDPKTNTGGLRFFLDKIQLLEPIYGGGFDEVPNAASNSMPQAPAAPAPMASPPVPPAPQPAPAPNPSPMPAAPSHAPFDLQAPATPPANAMQPSQGVPSGQMPNDIEDEIPF